MTIFETTPFLAVFTLAYISSCYALFYLFTLERKPRFSFWLSFALIFIIDAAFTLFANSFHEMLALRVIWGFIVRLSVLLIVFKGSVLNKILIVILGDLLCIFAEMLSVAVYSVLYDITTINTLSTEINIILFVCYILTFSIMTYLVRSIKSEGTRRDRIKLTAVIALFFVTCVSILMVFGNPTYLTTVSKQTVWFLAAGVFASLGSSVLVVSLMLGISKSQRIAYENALLVKQNENQAQHYEALAEHQKQVRVLRHDIVNHIATVSELFAEGQADESKKYADEVLKQYRSISQIDYCKHMIADALLTAKAKDAEDKGIAFHCSASIPETLPIENISVVSVISNLLDNAINAAELAEGERYVNFSARVASSCLFIKTVNSYSPNSVKVRHDKQLHGLGTGIIEDIVSMRNGSFERVMSDGVCTVTCSLPFEDK